MQRKKRKAKYPRCNHRPAEGENALIMKQKAVESPTHGFQQNKTLGTGASAARKKKQIIHVTFLRGSVPSQKP